MLEDDDDDDDDGDDDLGKMYIHWKAQILGLQFWQMNKPIWSTFCFDWEHFPESLPFPYQSISSLYPPPHTQPGNHCFLSLF